MFKGPRLLDRGAFTQPETAPDVLSPQAREAQEIIEGYRAAKRAAMLLGKHEFFWRDHAAWFESQGYKLRPRYQIGWEPPSTGLDDVKLGDEDHLSMPRAAVVDAIRITDGKRVLLKKISKSEHPFEVEITKLLSSDALTGDPHNCCVRLLDVLQPTDAPEITILVFPFLQQLTASPFDTFGEIVGFIKQILDGLQFLHHHRIAHRDIGIPNFMMDGDEMFPGGWNAVRGRTTPRGQKHANIYTRTQRPPRYYFIDFGLSRCFDPSDTNPLAEPIFGGDRTVPEFKTNKGAFNPFQTDIYYIGNTIREFIMKGTPSEYKGYYGTGFLEPLIRDMVQDDPAKRPTIDEVVMRFDKICRKLSSWKLRSRPIPRRGSISKGLRRHIDHWKRRIDYIKQGVPPIPSRPSL
ncbi:hypothetical protein BDN72DRAFT_813212 [Pluteus cervinus]|uniref:Uncharacterized protein n=1 Tax=Pluteus cervinus TaxID=181527 RepID=A0ACD3B9D4_9AGAR|nr:hypothetical protein BDN72DRAFT_813212 [Pluteus cervinus]